MKKFCDNIIDIKFFNKKSYELRMNERIDKKEICVKNIELTTHELENIISTISYEDLYNSFDKSKKTIVENFRFPAFISVFYDYIFKENTIPTASQFIENYFNYFLNTYENKCTVKKEYTDDFDVEFESNDIKARLLRVYPSLIRDFHFYLMCVESNIFNEVTYSLTDDLNGNDIIIKYNDETYYISLFIKSSRGEKYKEQKYNRHNYNNIKEIILKCDFCNNYFGDIKLYDKNNLNNLIHQIRQFESESYKS